MKVLFGFNKALRILLISNILIAFASAMLGPLYALFVERIGGDILDASMTGAAFMAAMAVTTYATGAVIDRTPHRRTILAGTIAPTKAGRSWAALDASESFVAAVGAVLGGILVSQFGFATIFVIMSALCLVSAVYVLSLPGKKV